MHETWNTFLRNLTFGQYEQNIPRELMDKLFNDLHRTSLIRQLAFSIKTGSNKITIPVDNNCTYGVEWTDMGDNREKTLEGKWQSIDIPAYTLHSRMIINHELLEDSEVDIENIIYDRIINKMSIAETSAFLYGTGNKQPTGLLTNLDNHTIFKIAMKNKKGNSSMLNDNLNEESAENIINVFIETYMSLSAENRVNAVWLVNRKFMNIINSLEKQYLLVNSAMTGMMGTINFLNLPLYIVDQLKDNHLAVLVDLKSSYCIVDRSDLAVFKDPYSAKPDIEFYFSKRLGGAKINSKSLGIITI